MRKSAYTPIGIPNALGHGLAAAVLLLATQAAATSLDGGPAGAEQLQGSSVYRAGAGPDDQYYRRLWSLSNVGQSVDSEVYPNHNPPGIAGSDINAQAAWEHVTDCSSVIVAVLDTGVDYTHPDLAANMWDGGAAYPNHGFDFVDNDNDPADDYVDDERDTRGHGTHVAGIVGARGNNGIGTTGVCWRVQIMAVRVANDEGDATYVDTLVRGIEFAVDNGADIVNMSLTGERAFDRDYADAIAYARDRDVVIVAAAGNGGSDRLGDDNDLGGADGNPNTGVYPCSFTHDNVICVAALDQAYQRAAFSNYGRLSVDVGAPGTNITSTRPAPEYLYDTRNGTSMAAPHVAGVAALLRAYNPDYTYADVVRAIENGGRWAPALEAITTSGRAVDAMGSLTYIDAPQGVEVQVQ